MCAGDSSRAVFDVAKGSSSSGPNAAPVMSFTGQPGRPGPAKPLGHGGPRCPVEALPTSRGFEVTERSN